MVRVASCPGFEGWYLHLPWSKWSFLPHLLRPAEEYCYLLLQPLHTSSWLLFHCLPAIHTPVSVFLAEAAVSSAVLTQIHYNYSLQNNQLKKKVVNTETRSPIHFSFVYTEIAPHSNTSIPIVSGAKQKWHKKSLCLPEGQ